MLKGHVFNKQTFTSDAFAITFDKQLQGRCGVFQGCALSNTTNSATIGAGFFVIKGRVLQIIGSETISNISNNGYYSLVCEVDLSKTNTEEALNQAEIKVLYNASAYPTLVQQDLFNGGTKYQYEFARFRVASGSITNFADKRTYLDFETLYDLVEQTLENLENQSAVLLKTGGTMSGELIASAGVRGNVTGNVTGNTSGSSGSCTGNSATATKLATARKINGTNFNGTADITTTKWGTARTLALTGAVSGSASIDGSGNVSITTTQKNIAVLTGKSLTTGSVTVNYPSGYTKENCVVLSAMAQGKTSAKGWSFGSVFDVSNTTSGSCPIRVTLGTEYMVVDISNIMLNGLEIIKNEAVALDFKIVLMKVS